jgi:hypothetical protein
LSRISESNSSFSSSVNSTACALLVFFFILKLVNGKKEKVRRCCSKQKVKKALEKIILNRQTGVSLPACHAGMQDGPKRCFHYERYEPSWSNLAASLCTCFAKMHWSFCTQCTGSNAPSYAEY